MKRFAMSMLVFAIAAGAAFAEEPIKVLIVDGQNNHKWQEMTPFMKAQLEKVGKFAVDVSTSPPKKAPKEAWDKWRPKFSDYKVVVSNYNGQMWPDEVKSAFEAYVKGGGGVLVIHAANNAFSAWKEYDTMIGLGWRGNKHGPRVYLDDSGKIVREEPGQGPGAGHGPQHEFQVVVRDGSHPITKGMPTKWMHAKDELYSGQRGPAADMTILISAFDAPRTKKNEPILWWIPYGDGKVVTNVMGHQNGQSLQCVGFITIMNRSCEWLATGKVTIPVPDNFPTADKVVKVSK